MSEPEDKNVRAVQALLAERARVGLAKYGVTTDRGDLSRLDWMLDGAVYLQRLIADEEKADGKLDAIHSEIRDCSLGIISCEELFASVNRILGPERGIST